MTDHKVNYQNSETTSELMVSNSNPRQEKVSSFPRDALEQAEIVRLGWDKVGNKLSVPNLSMERFLEKLSEAKQHVRNAEQLKAERAHAIHERNLCLSELWDLTKRIRHAAKATFGDYSNEFESLVHLKR